MNEDNDIKKLKTLRDACLNRSVLQRPDFIFLFDKLTGKAAF
jgi:hypothetical protein